MNIFREYMKERNHLIVNFVHMQQLTDTTFKEHIQRIAFIQRVHEVMKPFRCEFCGYATSHKHSLSKHIKAVHEGKKQY